MRAMKWFSRLVLSLLLLAVSGFCVFGFLATFEPLPPLGQRSWRTGYCIAAVLCVWGIIRLWRPKRPAGLA